MKIIFEPTQKDLPKDIQFPHVEIATDYDHMDMNQYLEELIVPALLALGFQRETIDKFITTEIA